MSNKGVSMKKFTAVMKNLWKDESGQGATEYVLLVVVVVALVVLFRNQITGAMSEKLSQLSSAITGFTGDGN
jgi:Flp pilus assembly pilin Flp